MHALILQPIKRRLALIALFGLLSACGYQLQKPLMLDPGSQPVYVNGNLMLAIALKRELIANDVPLSKRLADAGSIVTVDLIDDDTRSYSISLDGRNAETLRTMTASIAWGMRAANNNSEAVGKTENDANRLLLATRTLSVEQVQIQNSDNVAAQASEAEQITGELRDALAKKMVNLMRYSQAGGKQE